jgi:hypothetical protein
MLVLFRIVANKAGIKLLTRNIYIGESDKICAPSGLLIIEATPALISWCPPRKANTNLGFPWRCRVDFLLRRTTYIYQRSTLSATSEWRWAVSRRSVTSTTSWATPNNLTSTLFHVDNVRKALISDYCTLRYLAFTCQKRYLSTFYNVTNVQLTLHIVQIYIKDEARKL